MLGKAEAPKTMRRLPRRYAHFVYGMIQAAITTAVATTVATRQIASADLHFVLYWIESWSLSLATMLPVVLLAAPIIQRAVYSLTEEKPGEKA
nr:MAG: GNAT family acetyltransferase [Pseudomonadota bacterium]